MSKRVRARMLCVNYLQFASQIVVQLWFCWQFHFINQIFCLIIVYIQKLISYVLYLCNLCLFTFLSFNVTKCYFMCFVNSCIQKSLRNKQIVFYLSLTSRWVSAYPQVGRKNQSTYTYTLGPRRGGQSESNAKNHVFCIGLLQLAGSLYLEINRFGGI